MENEFIKQLYQSHQKNEGFPGSQAVYDFTAGILQALFPALSDKPYASEDLFREDYAMIRKKLFELLLQIRKQIESTPEELVKAFMAVLPDIHSKINTDIKAIVKGDPAAHSEFEVIRAYPGFYAIALYRIAHELHKLSIPIIPRMITESAHSKTGIDIHPGATIAPHFCIDHGTGIVIGETSVIGAYVKLYQGVTLGALSVEKRMAQEKRHPTIEDYVVIYANATILGGSTVIGAHSVIGGSVWLTKSVPPYSTVYHKPQIEVSKANHRTDLNL
jgi:serine O-acetyltransferase